MDVIVLYKSIYQIFKVLSISEGSGFQDYLGSGLKVIKLEYSLRHKIKRMIGCLWTCPQAANLCASF